MAKTPGLDHPVASGTGPPTAGEHPAPGDQTLAEQLAKSRKIIADARRML